MTPEPTLRKSKLFQKLPMASAEPGWPAVTSKDAHSHISLPAAPWHGVLAVLPLRGGDLHALDLPVLQGQCQCGP